MWQKGTTSGSMRRTWSGADSMERRVRPHSSEEWTSLFESYGFVPLPLNPLALNSLQEMLDHFPRGYGIRCEVALPT